MPAAGVTSAAGLALAFAGDYLGVFLDVPATPAALVFLLLVALLNARGIRESLRANLVMTLVEVSGLVLVVVLGALVLGRGDGDLGRTVEFPPGVAPASAVLAARSEEHTSELQSRQYLVCRLLLEKKKKNGSDSPLATNNALLQQNSRPAVEHEREFNNSILSCSLTY